MKAALVFGPLTAGGLVLAGCGSGTTPSGTTRSGTVTVVGTTTVAHLPTGTPVHCKHGPGAQVPGPGEGVTGNADGPSSSAEIQVTHRRDGSVVASCRGG